MKSGKKYVGKILLFGEYSVLRGGSALTIPYRNVSGYLDFLKSSSTPEHLKSNAVLKKFVQYLRISGDFNFQRFFDDVEKGLFFNSTIPAGYGVGSSGALVAAVYGKYIDTKHNKHQNLSELKKYMAKMESFFHGISSGTDPLSSYIQKPLYILGNEIKIFDTNDTRLLNLFLLDTGKPGSTENLVKLFNEKCTDTEFADRIDNELVTANLCSVDAFVKGKHDELAVNFKKISEIEYYYLSEMIPEVAHSAWLKGIETDEFYLKLCGSGGGGFLVGLSNVSKDRLELDYPVIWLK